MRVYNRRKKEKHIFWWVYLGIFLITVAFVGMSVMSVKSLLVEYEQRQPDTQVRLAIKQLAEKAASPEEFCKEYAITIPEPGKYEADLDIEKDYLALFSDPDTDYAVKPGSASENEMGYIIRNGELTLAEVYLKATSPLETKLAVFSMRDWEISSVKVTLVAKDYTVSVPSDFSVSVNGISIEPDSTEAGKNEYSVNGLFLQPEFVIADSNGNTADYYFTSTGKVLADIYDYDLVLPRTLTVTVNGNVLTGSDNGDGYISYNITELKKPEVTVSDLYSNTVEYEGGSIPLTATTLLAKEGYSVTVDSKPLPEEAIAEGLSPEYKFLESIIEELPKQQEYSIAVLKADAEITVTDNKGNNVELDLSKSYNDLTLTSKGEDKVPDEIAKEVDVLAVAKNWSLFMSNDFSFNQLSEYLLKDSDQYEVAYKYSTSVDKTFFSGHTLMDPAFTDTSVKNFVMITDNSFSVDISLTKHMLLNSNQKVDDSMNDRFYFVKEDGKWLLVGMKEVTDNVQ